MTEPDEVGWDYHLQWNCGDARGRSVFYRPRKQKRLRCFKQGLELQKKPRRPKKKQELMDELTTLMEQAKALGIG